MATTSTGDSAPASDIRAIAIFSAYLLLALHLTGYLVVSIAKKASWGSSADSPTAGTTRHVVRQVVVFSIMAATSLGVTWFYIFAYFQWSYNDWATLRGLAALESSSDLLDAWRAAVAGVTGSGNKSSSTVQLGAWLRDTRLFQQAWEIVLTGRYNAWWSQQIFIITTFWSLFLGYQGRRRTVPYPCLFMLLGQIVAVSFAMNLFFVAVTLGAEQPAFDQDDDGKKRTAKSSPSKKPASSPSQTASKGRFSIQLRSAVVYFSTTTSLALAFSLHWLSLSNSSFFLPALAVSHLLLFNPCTRLPVRADSSCTGARFFQALTILLVVGIFSTATWRVFAVAKTNFNKALITALASHPAVSSVGWDVMLSWLSALLWSRTNQVEAQGFVGSALVPS